MVKVFDIISRVAHDGTVMGTMSRETEWELEELKGSTNRLKVEVPLEDSMDVATDEELIFRKRRYIITELSRHKNSRITEIIADEAQMELSSRRVKRLQLDKATLGDALDKALRNTDWTVGTVFDPQIEFNAELENQTVSYCLDFLENQAGGRLKFDSVNKTVSILDNTEQEPVTTFHYKRNLDDISKTEVQPKATVLYPYGKEGMNIESLNDGLDYIEDFSWYTGLGMSLSEARERFRKELVWEDNRYIYVGNLLREAKKRLASLSHPQINYAIKTASLQSMDLHIDDSVYVVDEELGIKIKTIVSRVITSNDPTRNEVELDYVPSSLSDIVVDNASGDSVGGDAEAVFVSKNAGREIISEVPTPVLSTSITVIASTFFHVSLAVQLNVTTAGTIRGHFTMDGEQIPTTIRQTASEGWYTIGLPFIITQVQEGSKNLDFYLYIEGGSGEVEAEGIELYVTSKGALGGTRNERPDQRVSDHIDLPDVGVDLQDVVDVHQERPVNPRITEHIQLPLTVIEMTDNASIELNGPITDPSTIPDGELVPVERGGFGNMADYEAFIRPSQEQVDQFITDHDDNSVFKIVSMGEQLFIFTTKSGTISVDYINRKVKSDLEMVILTASGELIEDVLEVDWLANIGAIQEHELYLHIPSQENLNKTIDDYVKGLLELPHAPFDEHNLRNFVLTRLVEGDQVFGAVTINYEGGLTYALSTSGTFMEELNGVIISDGDIHSYSTGDPRHRGTSLDFSAYSPVLFEGSHLASLSNLSKEDKLTLFTFQTTRSEVSTLTEAGVTDFITNKIEEGAELFGAITINFSGGLLYVLSTTGTYIKVEGGVVSSDGDMYSLSTDYDPVRRGKEFDFSAYSPVILEPFEYRI